MNTTTWKKHIPAIGRRLELHPVTVRLERLDGASMDDLADKMAKELRASWTSDKAGDYTFTQKDNCR